MTQRPWPLDYQCHVNALAVEAGVECRGTHGGLFSDRELSYIEQAYYQGLDPKLCLTIILVRRDT